MYFYPIYFTLNALSSVGNIIIVVVLLNWSYIVSLYSSCLLLHFHVDTGCRKRRKISFISWGDACGGGGGGGTHISLKLVK